MDWLEILNGVLAEVIEFVAYALIPFLAAIVMAWFKKMRAKLEAETSAQLADVIFIVAKHAVLAAEQAGLLDAAIDKKDHAIEIAEKFLAEIGVDVDLDPVGDAVEAAVMDQFNILKQIEA